MQALQSESKLMQACRALRLESVAWSLRRLHCPIGPDALVLEVGAGGNPYPRSNVLLDAYEESQQRHWEPLRKDRPFVFGFIENLPFKDRAFDFLIACHVLEHSTHPERAVAEFQRVAKAGYIEVPDALFERLFPYRDHRLEIKERNGRLVIRKKGAWLVDSDLNELYHHRASKVLNGSMVRRHPFAFHVRYYWQDHIDFVVENPEIDNTWPAEISERPAEGRIWRKTLRSAYLDLVNRVFAQTRRNAQIDISGLLRCPTCSSGDLSSNSTSLSCNTCHTSYRCVNGAPVLYAGGKASQ